MKTRGYKVEFVRPSVRLSRFMWGIFAREFGMKELSKGFKFYTRINQGLKSCLVKVLSQSVKNCRLWSNLKIVDFKLFFRCQALCAGKFGLKQLIELELSNFIHV